MYAESAIRPAGHRLSLLGLALAEALLLSLGIWLGWMPVVMGSALLLVLWSLGPDFRWTCLASMGVGAVTLYTGGHLTRDLAVVSALGLASVALAVREYRLRGWGLPPSRPMLALGLWFAATAYGAVLGVLRGNQQKAAGLEIFGALALGTAFLGPLWRSRPRPFRGAALAFLALSYLSASFGLTYYLLIYHRRLMDAWFSPLPAMGAVLLICFSLYAERPALKWGCLVLSLPLNFHLLLSYTRGYWFGFMAALLGLSLLYLTDSRQRSSLPARMVMLLALLGVVAGGLALGSRALLEKDAGSSLSRRFESSFSTQTTGNTISNFVRLMEMVTTGRLVAENPVVGYGTGATIVLKDPLLATRTEQPYIHQMYLFQWYKFGLPGLCALLYLFWVFLQSGWREARCDERWERRAWGAAAFANTLMVVVISLTNYSLNQVYVAMPLGFLWGLLLPISHRGRALGTPWAGTGR